MMTKTITAVILAVTLTWTSALAGDQPEFDTVGCDSTNFFNTLANDIVSLNNSNGNVLINDYSDFTDDCDAPVIVDTAMGPQMLCNPLFGATGFWEYFKTNANQAVDDLCFSGYRELKRQGSEYQSHLATAFNEYWFEWQMVLQKKPQTDLNLNIVDCVVKPNASTLFGSSPYDGAEQTGRFSGFMSPGTFWFMGGNPRITVWAIPGPNAPEAFKVSGPVLMDARTIPGLETKLLDEALYTSKGLWDESIVIIMPETGVNNANGNAQFRLRSGDRIKVRVDIPEMSTADIRYGQDNVSVRYIAIHGTEYVDTESATVTNEAIFCTGSKLESGLL